MSRTSPVFRRAALNLPIEILESVLVSLGDRDLASASLVSRTWRTIAFRHLYHTVHLTFAEDLTRFSERLSYEQDTQLSVASFTRRLIIDHHTHNYRSQLQGAQKRTIRESDLHLLVAIIPALTRLEHFSCPLFTPRHPQLFQVLRECHIKSIGWDVEKTFEDPDDSDYSDDDDNRSSGGYWSLFDFQGLSHFSLNLLRIDEHLDELEVELAPVVSLVHACPNLEYLELSLGDQNYPRSSWSLDDFIGALDSWTSPDLHTFRAPGSVYWLTFPYHREESPLLSFFGRHPGLHTISLGWTLGSAESCLPVRRLGPDDMPELFPSLRHFEAPAFLCGPVLASSLAKQIESITILDEGDDDPTSNLHYIASVVTQLPRLRKMVLKGLVADDDWPGVLPIEPLKTVLRATPALEELEFDANPYPHEKIVEALTIVSNLRVLAIRSYVLRQAGIGKTWEVCVHSLAMKYPLLRCVKDMGYSDNNEYWVIDRGVNGNIVVNRRASY